MKILYSDSGKIYHAVPDNDWFYFSHSTNIPLVEMIIDELAPSNKSICIGLRKTIGKVDIDGDEKYKVIGGELQEKEGWEEYFGDI